MALSLSFISNGGGGHADLPGSLPRLMTDYSIYPRNNGIKVNRCPLLLGNITFACRFGPRKRSSLTRFVLHLVRLINLTELLSTMTMRLRKMKRWEIYAVACWEHNSRCLSRYTRSGKHHLCHMSHFQYDRNIVDALRTPGC